MLLLKISLNYILRIHKFNFSKEQLQFINFQTTNRKYKY